MHKEVTFANLIDYYTALHWQGTANADDLKIVHKNADSVRNFVNHQHS